MGQGAAGVQGRNLRQRAHLLARQARSGADPTGARANRAVDRGAGAAGAMTGTAYAAPEAAGLVSESDLGDAKDAVEAILAELTARGVITG